MEVLYEKIKGKDKEYIDLFEENQKLKIHIDELLIWKKNHVCKINSDDIEKDIINEINSSKNINLDNLKTNIRNELKEEYENTISKLNDDIIFLKTDKKDDIKEYIPIEDNILKQTKEQNDSLLKSKINNSSNNIKKSNSSQISKNKSLHDSIFVFQDIDENWQKYISCFTYKYILKMVKLDKFINDDNKVNKEDYKEIYKWLNIYELDEKKIKLNYNIKRKIKRCKIIYDKYQDKLKYIKFNINSLSYIKNNKFDDFLNILDEKINQRNIPKIDFGDLSDDILIKYSILNNINKDINNGFNNIDFSKFNFNFKTNKNNEDYDNVETM
jgi:hypothetical protein